MAINYLRVEQRNKADEWLKSNNLYDEFINTPEFLKAEDYKYALSKGMPPYEGEEDNNYLDQDKSREIWRITDNIDAAIKCDEYETEHINKDEVKKLIDILEDSIAELKNIIK